MVFNKENIKTIAIVGARSGSRSLEDKNIRSLLGKPLMAWVITAAKNAKLIDRVLVSTDSQKYADIAKEYGAEAPFLRPKEMATDSSHDLEYLTHALNWLKDNEGYVPDIVFKVSANCPLFKSEYFDQCVKLFIEDPVLDTVYPAFKADKHPYKMWKVENERLRPLFTPEATGFKEPFNMSRQLLPPVYIHCGVFSLRYDTIMEMKATIGKEIGYIEIPPEDGFDIDNKVDLKLAEMLLKKRENLFLE